MRILITGASGFIGSSLVVRLADPKYNLYLASRSSEEYFSQSNICKFHQVNWNSQQDLQEICKNIDVIIHAAGMNANDSLKDPLNAEFFNGTVTTNLVNAAVASKVNRFIFLSTAHVYKSPLEGKILESNNLTNSHPYATSHVSGENAVLDAAKNSFIDGLVLRVSNVFGTPEIENINCWDLFVNNLCMQAFTKSQLKITGNPFQERDFIAKTDFVKVLDNLINYPNPFSPNHIVNIGSGISHSLFDMAHVIKREYEKIFNSNINIIKNPDPENEKYETLHFSSSLNNFFKIKIPNSSINEIRSLLNFCASEFGQ